MADNPLLWIAGPAVILRSNCRAFRSSLLTWNLVLAAALWIIVAADAVANRWQPVMGR
jgi:hypothetical protein